MQLNENNNYQYQEARELLDKLSLLKILRFYEMKEEFDQDKRERIESGKYEPGWPEFAESYPRLYQSISFILELILEILALISKPVFWFIDGFTDYLMRKKRAMDEAKNSMVESVKSKALKRAIGIVSTILK